MLFVVLCIILYLIFLKLVIECLIRYCVIGDNFNFFVVMLINCFWLLYMFLFVFFKVKVGWIINGYLICFVNWIVFFIELIILDFGIGWLSFFINCLNKLWFLVLLMVDNLVFNSLIFNFFRILFFDRVIVIFNLVWFLRVGRRVLGFFFLRIFVINFKVIGLI